MLYLDHLVDIYYLQHVSLVSMYHICCSRIQFF